MLAPPGSFLTYARRRVFILHWVGFPVMRWREGVLLRNWGSSYAFCKKVKGKYQARNKRLISNANLAPTIRGITRSMFKHSNCLHLDAVMHLDHNVAPWCRPPGDMAGRVWPGQRLEHFSCRVVQGHKTQSLQELWSAIPLQCSQILLGTEGNWYVQQKSQKKCLLSTFFEVITMLKESLEVLDELLHTGRYLHKCWFRNLQASNHSS